MTEQIKNPKKKKNITLEELLEGDEPIQYEPPCIIKKWKLAPLQTGWGSYPGNPTGKLNDDVEIKDTIV